MNDPVETQLRAAFETKLQSVSPEREARLRAFDYRSSTTHHRQKVWAALGASSTALAGAIVGAVLILSSGASTAYGWTPIPTRPTSAAFTAAIASCNWLERGTGRAVLTGTPVLTDARGKYTAAIYRDGAATRVCISDGQHTHTSLSTTRARPGLNSYNPGPDQLGPARGGNSALPGFPGSQGSNQPGQETDISGLAGPDVSAVTFTLSNGVRVSATVENGLYFAWWPYNIWAASVTIKTSSGDRSSPVPIQACHANRSGCVFASAHPGQRSP